MCASEVFYGGCGVVPQEQLGRFCWVVQGLWLLVVVLVVESQDSVGQSAGLV